MDNFGVRDNHYRHFFSPYTTYSFNDFNDSKLNLPFYSILEIFYNKGFYGVHMFYAISGFVFAHVYLSYNEKISGKEFFINFCFRNIKFFF